MAERKAQQKYYPPEWTPADGPINYFARKLAPKKKTFADTHGVRIEMPFNVWCLKCENHIGMGVRYNAQQSTIGMYYSTPIYSFILKCHRCGNIMELNTDPKNTQYVIVSGARKRIESYNPEDIGVISIDKEVGLIDSSTAFAKLEHTVDDVKKGSSVNPYLTTLQNHNDKHWADPYSASQSLRRVFREDKKVRVQDKLKSDFIAQKMSLDLEILPLTESDLMSSRQVEFDRSESPLKRKKRLESAHVFSKKSSRSVIVDVKRPVDPFAISIPKKVKVGLVEYESSDSSV